MVKASRFSPMWSCVLLTSAFLGFPHRPANAEEIKLIGLQTGSYSVGFKYIYALDSSRIWKPFPAKEGETPTGKELRPIRIGIWYPASDEDAKPMPYRMYVSPKTDDPYFTRLNDVMARYDVWSYKGMFDDDETIYERLMEAQTTAYLDAPPAAGPFPVVLYSAGWYSRSPDNTVWAEYLASHGYVVVTVPQLGPGVVEFDFRITPESVVTQIEDLLFALNKIVAEPYADTERVAAAGFSMGGLVALLAQQRDPRIDAVIGMDASFLREDSLDLTIKSPDFASDVCTVPLLAFHRGHRSQVGDLTKEVLDSLTSADRYFVVVKSATHGEFSNEPHLFASLELPWLREHWNSQKEALAIHSAVTEYSKRFLDGVFGGDRAITEWIARPSELVDELASYLMADRSPPSKR